MKVKRSLLRIHSCAEERFRDTIIDCIEDEGIEELLTLYSNHPVKYNTKTKALSVPYFSDESSPMHQKYTKVVCEALEHALYASAEWSEGMDWDDYNRLKKAIELFLKTGSFQPAKEKAPKPSKAEKDRLEQAKAEVEAMFLDYTEQCATFAISHFDYFGVSRHDEKIQYAFGCSPKRYKSNAQYSRGQSRISYAIYRRVQNYLDNAQLIRRTEYKAFSGDPVIGNIDGSLQKVIFATCAHEYAHIVQMRAEKIVEKECNKGNKSYTWHGFTKKDISKPHGEAWKFIYRVLRKHLVNVLD